MADYKIFETERFQKDLAAISRGSLPHIEKKLRSYVYPQLRQEPHVGSNIKRLKGWLPPAWRYRVADWRFFYEVDEARQIVFMTAASHRKDAY